MRFWLLALVFTLLAVHAHSSHAQPNSHSSAASCEQKVQPLSYKQMARAEKHVRTFFLSYNRIQSLSAKQLDKHITRLNAGLEDVLIPHLTLLFDQAQVDLKSKQATQQLRKALGNSLMLLADLTEQLRISHSAVQRRVHQTESDNQSYRDLQSKSRTVYHLARGVLYTQVSAVHDLNDLAVREQPQTYTNETPDNTFVWLEIDPAYDSVDGGSPRRSREYDYDSNNPPRTGDREDGDRYTPEDLDGNNPPRGSGID